MFGPLTEAFVGSNSLLSGHWKEVPGAFTGEMLSQVTDCSSRARSGEEEERGQVDDGAL